MKCSNCSTSLLKVQYQSDLLLCTKCRIRWVEDNGKINRDYHGESEWARMGGYVNKSYAEAFDDEVRFIISDGAPEECVESKKN